MKDLSTQTQERSNLNGYMMQQTIHMKYRSLFGFYKKTATNFKSVVCLMRSALLSRKKCVILMQAQSFYTDPGENLFDT